MRWPRGGVEGGDGIRLRTQLKSSSNCIASYTLITCKSDLDYIAMFQLHSSSSSYMDAPVSPQPSYVECSHAGRASRRVSDKSSRLHFCMTDDPILRQNVTKNTRKISTRKLSQARHRFLLVTGDALPQPYIYVYVYASKAGYYLYTHHLEITEFLSVTTGLAFDGGSS